MSAKPPPPDIKLSPEKLECGLCFQYARNAFESSCCGQVFCQECTHTATYRCRLCAATDRRFFPSRGIRNIIAGLPVVCRYSCGEENITRATLASHEETCTKRIYSCTIHGCDFYGPLQDTANHSAQQHAKDVIVSMKKAASPKVYYCPLDDCDTEDQKGMTGEKLRNHLTDDHEEDDFYSSYDEDADTHRGVPGGLRIYLGGKRIVHGSVIDL